MRNSNREVLMLGEVLMLTDEKKKFFGRFVCENKSAWTRTDQKTLCSCACFLPWNVP